MVASLTFEARALLARARTMMQLLQRRREMMRQLRLSLHQQLIKAKGTENAVRALFGAREAAGSNGTGKMRPAPKAKPPRQKQGK